MAILVRAVGASDGSVSLRFPFSAEVVAYLKSIPGMRWNAIHRHWDTSKHGLVALRHALQNDPNRPSGISLMESSALPAAPVPILQMAAQKLRDYQVVGAQQLLSNSGFFLTMEQRTGKTRTAITAAASLLAAQAVARVFVIYPNQAKHEWINQFQDHIGLPVETLSGRTPLDNLAIQKLVKQPWKVIGIHHEILGDHGDDLIKIANAGRYAVILDEGHLFKERKAPRSKLLQSLGAHRNGAYRWVLTGTPLRNRPEDLWTTWEFAFPGSTNGFWAWAKRYAAAYEAEYGWNTKGASNEAELRERLASVSYRVTREQVASHLPKSDRATIMVDLAGKDAAKYKAQEKAFAAQIGSVLQGTSINPAALKAMENLAQLTVPSKINVVVERLRYHCEGRGAKVVVFANFHDSLRQVEAKLCPPADPATGVAKPPLAALPVFCVGGWILPDKRKALVDAWKAVSGPAVLLANTMSSGTGIDLADADTSIFVELAWVPADVLQAESRTQDVHLGKATTPRVYEYILARNTMDADMALAVLRKLQNIDAVVGKDQSSQGVAAMLKDAGLVDRGALGLDRTDPNAANDALSRLRDRLLGIVAPSDDSVARAQLAADITDADFDDDEESDDDDSDTNDV